MDDPKRTVEQLLVHHRDRLQARIRWMMGAQARRAGDSGDFLGELSQRILEDAASLEWRDSEHFLALATRMARNLIVDRVRRPRVRRFESFTARLCLGDVPEPNADTPSQAAVAGEDVERVLAALEQLPEEHQQVIELRHFEGLGFSGIGERMGRSENAVQLLHARAITALGRRLRGAD